MNRNILVTILVVIVIIAVGAGYMFVNNSATSPSISEKQPEASIVTTTEKTSLKSFMSMTGTQKCNFNDPDSETSGEIYMGEGQVRGDFVSKMGDKPVTSHMVNDGTDVYVWMDDQATGFKTSLKAMEEMSNQEGVTGVNQTVDLNKQVDYKCESWTLDKTKFAVPVEVKFQDVGAMMQNVQGMQSALPNASIPAGANQAACAACDNLEGAQRTQCKTALKCN